MKREGERGWGGVRVREGASHLFVLGSMSACMWLCLRLCVGERSLYTHARTHTHTHYARVHTHTHTLGLVWGSWKTFYLHSSASLQGGELCDCFRPEGPWSPEFEMRTGAEFDAEFEMSTHTRRGRLGSVRRPTRGLAVPSIPSMRTISNTIMV